jgi:hypothetical protein
VLLRAQTTDEAIRPHLRQVRECASSTFRSSKSGNSSEVKVDLAKTRFGSLPAVQEDPIGSLQAGYNYRVKPSLPHVLEQPTMTVDQIVMERGHQCTHSPLRPLNRRGPARKRLVERFNVSSLLSVGCRILQ